MTPDNQPALLDSVDLVIADLRKFAELEREEDNEPGAFALDCWANRLESLRRAEGATLGEGREWIACDDRMPNGADIDANGDVVWLRSGVECLGRALRGKPVDATHWKRTGATPTAQRVPSVLDFGAIGDGVTDDSAAFQAAANYSHDMGAQRVAAGEVTDPESHNFKQGLAVGMSCFHELERLIDKPVCARCGATSAKDAEAKCSPDGDSCPGTDGPLSKLWELGTPPPTGEAVAWIVRGRCDDVFTKEAAARSFSHAVDGELIPLYTHPAAQAEGRFPARFFCSGPEGSFWTDSKTLSNALITNNRRLDRDEWTVTDTLTAPADVGVDRGK